MAGDGADVGFPADEFRSAITAAMVMGSPTTVLDKATFRWARDQDFAREDPGGRPYTWSAAVVDNETHPDVVKEQVAVEYTPARTLSGTPAGEFVPVRGKITMLDVDHAAVVGANLVLLHQDVWVIVAETQEALFSVDVFTLFIERQ